MTEMITYLCQTCETPVTKPKCKYERAVREGMTPKYCSNECRNQGRRQETELKKAVREAKFPLLEAR